MVLSSKFSSRPSLPVSTSDFSLVHIFRVLNFTYKISFLDTLSDQS